MCTLDGCGTHSSLPLPKVDDEKRRLFLAGIGSLPLASVLAYPELAAAQAARVQDAPLELSNGVKVLGVLAMPETLPAPAVVLIHEWWGLNDQIKAVAQELANEGYLAYAIDLYRGQVTESAQQARALMQSVDTGIAISQLGGVADFLKNHEACNGKVGTLGWCFGGGWSINAAMALDIDASVVYYGRLPQSVQEVSRIQAPVLGHFGTEDLSIDEKMVGGFERAMQQAGKSDLLDVNWYTADHAFANPTGSRYDSDDAALAWSRTLTFFARHLLE